MQESDGDGDGAKQSS